MARFTYVYRRRPCEADTGTASTLDAHVRGRADAGRASYCREAGGMFTCGVSFLQSLPFQKVQHKVDTRDAQPTGDGQSLTVLVTGMLLVCNHVSSDAYIIGGRWPEPTQV